MIRNRYRMIPTEEKNDQKDTHNDMHTVQKIRKNRHVDKKYIYKITKKTHENTT